MTTAPENPELGRKEGGGVPDTDQRWTVLVSNGRIVGLVGDSGNRVLFSNPRMDAKAVEVVPLEALSVEREGREKAEHELDALKTAYLGTAEEAHGLRLKVAAVRSVSLGVAAELGRMADEPLALAEVRDAVAVPKGWLRSLAATLKEDQ